MELKKLESDGKINLVKGINQLTGWLAARNEVQLFFCFKWDISTRKHNMFFWMDWQRLSLNWNLVERNQQTNIELHFIVC